MVVRDAAGSPTVIRNAPLLDDGTPMPTRYWLVGRAERAAVDRLEAAGRGAGRRIGRRPGRAGGGPRPVRGRTRRRRFRRTGRGPARPAASAAPAGASSACTPTTPGIWPAATTRSGAGWRTAWPQRGPARSAAIDCGTNSTRLLVAGTGRPDPGAADAHHPPRSGSRPGPPSRPGRHRAHRRGPRASTGPCWTAYGVQRVRMTATSAGARRRQPGRLLRRRGRGRRGVGPSCWAATRRAACRFGVPLPSWTLPAAPGWSPTSEAGRRS